MAEKGKPHRNVLNRCLSELVNNLDFPMVSMYMQEKDVLKDVIIRDISDQRTTSDKIRELITRIQQRDKNTYEKFKECLVQAGQTDLKDKLEEQEKIETKQCTDPGNGILRSEVGHMIVNTQPSMQGASSITHDMNERQMESLSSSVAAMRVLSTHPLSPGSQATSSQASQDHDTSSSSSGTDKEAYMEKGHVMISYSWGQQKKALWIKEQLENNGYPIWIDVENMGSKLHESMAKAVKEAYVVLLCMSKTYMESKMCELEALYAEKKKKIIIPLKMEDFEPDDWLDISTVDYIYRDFSGKKSYEAEMKELLKALAIHYKKEFKQPQITPFASFVVPQEKTESDQDQEAN